ncbi:uncharacterized protein LOC131236441 [Magnolia sinica]|uniref:uncharacterized protein LOC131236441 n=1 Tax=Magnolia sinica TaxID=86752 RepID=UPI0026586591|nr:uncharacterized protein LOC131236441 [Magnolia sinica]
MVEDGAPSPPPPQTLENPIAESQKLGNEIEETSSSKKKRKEPEPDQADPETEDSDTGNAKKLKTEVSSSEGDDSNGPLPLQRMENGLVLHSLEALDIEKWHAAGDINSEAEEEEIMAIVVVAVGAACAMAAVWCYEKYYKPRRNESHKQLKEEEQAEEMIANAMNSVASAICKITEVMHGGNRVSKMKSLFAEIQKVPNLSEPLFFKAYKYLAADEHKATLFLVLDEDTRREWLLMHLDEV